MCAKISADHPIAAPMREASPVLEELFFADASCGVIMGQTDQMMGMILYGRALGTEDVNVRSI